MKEMPRCRVLRDFVRPDGGGVYSKGFDQLRPAAVLRDKWIEMGLIELIGEKTVAKKVKRRTKSRRKPKVA